MSTPILLQNAIAIPEDSTYILSPPAQPDEPITHIYARDGATITIWGGHDFAHRDGDFRKLFCANRYEEWTLTNEHSFESIADKLLILQPYSDPETGKAQPWRLKPIKDMDVKALTKLIEAREKLGRADWELVNRVARRWLNVKTQPLTPV